MTLAAPPDAVTPGVLDDVARRLFMTGQCHALALAVCERAGDGWEMAGYFDHRMRVLHVVAVAPDGVHVDVTGARTLEQLDACEPPVAQVAPVTVADIAGWVESGHYVPMDRPLAASLAGPVLAQAGYPLDDVRRA